MIPAPRIRVLALAAAFAVALVTCKSGTEPTGSSYHIVLRPQGTISSAHLAAFDAAVARWREVIVQDLADININVAAGTCGPGSPAINERIDDLLIFVSIVPIDGVGNVLGSAGPCLIRNANLLPVAGVMRFDSADIAALSASGELNLVVLHEMGHVLGVGPLWDSTFLDLLADPAGDPHFTGAQAIAGFDAVGGTTYVAGPKVPVEDSGGTGTVLLHWRESVFDTELMTGFLDSGLPNPMSIVTVAALADMGYTVDPAAAETYGLVAALRAAGRTSVPLDLGNDVLRLPLAVVDDAGRVLRVVRW